MTAHVTSSKSLPIKDTFFRRYVTLIALKLLKRHCKKLGGGVFLLTPSIVVKSTQCTDLSEAASMQFVAKHTSLPVPKVHCAFVHRNRTYIVQERIRGTMCGEDWSRRPEEWKLKILGQLSVMIKEMRAIPRPSGMGVASVDGGSFFDARYQTMTMRRKVDVWRHGPYTSAVEFQRDLRDWKLPADYNLDGPSHFAQGLKRLIQLQEKDYPLCFTHGDLHSHNILVRGDEVVGIVDWESAGWMPAYWEYTMAKDVNPYNEHWKDEVDRFLEPCPEELEMEELRRMYFSPFGCQVDQDVVEKPKESFHASPVDCMSMEEVQGRS